MVGETPEYSVVPMLETMEVAAEAVVVVVAHAKLQLQQTQEEAVESVTKWWRFVEIHPSYG